MAAAPFVLSLSVFPALHFIYTSGKAAFTSSPISGVEPPGAYPRYYTCWLLTLTTLTDHPERSGRVRRIRDERAFRPRSSDSITMGGLNLQKGTRCSICNAFRAHLQLWSTIMHYQSVTLDLQTCLVVCPRWSPLTIWRACAVGEVTFRVVHTRTPEVMMYIKRNWLPACCHLVSAWTSNLTSRNSYKHLLFMFGLVGFRLFKWWVDAIFAFKLGSCQCTHFFPDKMSQISYVQFASEQIAINVSLYIIPGARFSVIFLFLWYPQYVTGSWTMIVI